MPSKESWWAVVCFLPCPAPQQQAVSCVGETNCADARGNPLVHWLEAPNHWSSPVHFTLKSDGTLRTVGDYRLLNQKTILDLYPLPQLSSFTDEIAGSTIFSKVDLFKAFHQILIDILHNLSFHRDNPPTL